jgi:hypothetical protein
VMLSNWATFTKIRMLSKSTITQLCPERESDASPRV